MTPDLDTRFLAMIAQAHWTITCGFVAVTAKNLESAFAERDTR